MPFGRRFKEKTDLYFLNLSEFVEKGQTQILRFSSSLSKKLFMKKTYKIGFGRPPESPKVVVKFA